MNYSLIHQIKNYSRKRSTPIKFNKLINYSNNYNNKILRTQFLHKELPIRISQRIIELNQLPYNLLKLNSMSKVYNLYNETFRKLIDFKLPKNLNESNKYSNILETIFKEHAAINNDIANALITYNNNYKMIKHEEEFINKILYNFYMSRLSIRFLIKQHLIINKNKNNLFGLINEKCNPYNLTQNIIMNIDQMSYIIYKKYPKIIINNDSYKGNFIYIDSHIEYIVTEILKNSVRSTMEFGYNSPKITIDIKLVKDELIIKISDNGLGFNRKKLNQLFNFTYSNALIDNYIDKKTIIAGYGHGLGLSRIYSRYFGGDLIIVPFEGVGCDVYIYLSKIDTSKENISIV